MRRALVLGAASTAVFFGGVKLAAHAMRQPKDRPGAGACGDRFDVLAPRYEAAIRREEALSGIDALRRAVVARVAGPRLLEAAAGTGINLPLLPARCREVVAVERAPGMVEQLERRAAEARAHADGRVVTVVEADVARLPFANGEFDGALQTFALCSYEDPVRALREVARVVKPGGQIVLLEHGRSAWTLVNWYLDWRTPAHEREWGCRFNRDIGEVVRASGLRVVEHERHHFGTTHIVVAVP